MSIIDSLSWRYAVKRMNGNKVSAEKVNTLMDAISLSASGFGLMPFQIFVVEDADLKAKIQPIAYGQPQIIESSHLLIFAAWNEVTAARIDTYMELIAETRQISLSDLGDFKGAIVGSMQHKSKEQQAQWADRQVYLAMGTALAAAAELKIDTTPMEGFIPAKLDELLGLEAKNLHSVLIMAIGERDEATDYMVNVQKVRTPKAELFVNL
jgi:nitroreductase/dihydropteridine reductase